MSDIYNVNCRCSVCQIDFVSYRFETMCDDCRMGKGPATITALRAEVEEWKHAASEWRSDLAGCVDRETALRAENERLRAALRDLLKVAEKWPMTAEYLAKIISCQDN